MHKYLFLALVLIGCDSASKNNDIQVNSQKETVQRSKPEIAEEAWRFLEGQWWGVQKKEDRYVLLVPCEGEKDNLFFSKRGEAYVLAIMEAGEIIFEQEVSSLEQENDHFVLSFQEKQSKQEFHKDQTILHWNDKSYSLRNEPRALERQYEEASACGLKVDLSHLPNLKGSWSQEPCGSEVMKITDDMIVYAEEPAKLLALDQQDNLVWLTLQTGVERYGILVEMKEDEIKVWNGKYPSWVASNLFKRTSACSQ